MKNVKKEAIFLKLSWYKVFILRKLKLLNFLVDSVLIYREWAIAISWLCPFAEIENETALDHSDQLDSIVIFHCDGKKEKDWEVLQFMPACQVGAKVNFRIPTPSSDEYRKIDTELNYLRCLKMRTARKYMTYSQGSHGNETKMHRTCNKFLEQQDNRKFEFKWVYFTDLSQYLIPFGAVVGAIVLAFIIGAVWECRKRGKKSGKFNSSSINIVGIICD